MGWLTCSSQNGIQGLLSTLDIHGIFWISAVLIYKVKYFR